VSRRLEQFDFVFTDDYVEFLRAPSAKYEKFKVAWDEIRSIGFSIGNRYEPASFIVNLHTEKSNSLKDFLLSIGKEKNDTIKVHAFQFFGKNDKIKVLSFFTELIKSFSDKKVIQKIKLSDIESNLNYAKYSTYFKISLFIIFLFITLGTYLSKFIF
jgi:hypothetical protein